MASAVHPPMHVVGVVLGDPSDPARIPDSHRDLLECPPVAALTTVLPDGYPQSSVVWCDIEGDTVRINTMRGFQKERNMRRDPRVTLLCYDPRHALRSLEVRGMVVQMTEDGAREHLDALASKYAGRPIRYFGDAIPARFAETEVPVLCRIRPTRVVALDATSSSDDGLRGAAVAAVADTRDTTSPAGAPSTAHATDAPHAPDAPDAPDPGEPADVAREPDTTRAPDTNAPDTIPIPASHLDLLTRPICGVLTTMLPDGQPQSSLVWVDHERGCAVVNTTLERRKGRDLLANPSMSLLVVDPDDTGRFIQIRGDAELVTAGALEHVDALTRKYTRHPRYYGFIYPMEQASRETRVICRIHARRITLDAIHASGEPASAPVPPALAGAGGTKAMTATDRPSPIDRSAEPPVARD